MVICPFLSLVNDEVQQLMNTVATFTFYDKDKISGSASSTCETSGTWNQETGECTEGNGIYLSEI